MSTANAKVSATPEESPLRTETRRVQAVPPTKDTIPTTQLTATTTLVTDAQPPSTNHPNPEHTVSSQPNVGSSNANAIEVDELCPTEVSAEEIDSWLSEKMWTPEWKPSLPPSVCLTALDAQEKNTLANLSAGSLELLSALRSLAGKIKTKRLSYERYLLNWGFNEKEIPTSRHAVSCNLSSDLTSSAHIGKLVEEYTILKLSEIKSRELELKKELSDLCISFFGSIMASILDFPDLRSLTEEELWVIQKESASLLLKYLQTAATDSSILKKRMEASVLKASPLSLPFQYQTSNYFAAVHSGPGNKANPTRFALLSALVSKDQTNSKVSGSHTESNKRVRDDDVEELAPPLPPSSSPSHAAKRHRGNLSSNSTAVRTQASPSSSSASQAAFSAPSTNPSASFPKVVFTPIPATGKGGKNTEENRRKLPSGRSVKGKGKTRPATPSSTPASTSSRSNTPNSHPRRSTVMAVGTTPLVIPPAAAKVPSSTSSSSSPKTA